MAKAPVENRSDCEGRKPGEQFIGGNYYIQAITFFILMGINRIRELLKLTPFLLSDGGLSPHSKNSWLIYFRNNDKTLIKEFRKQLNICCGKNGYLQKRKDGSFMVKLTSIKL